MTDKLIVAVPSKGRLQENANAFFARAGLLLRQQGGARDYRGAFNGVNNVDVVFLSAAEITAQLAGGGAHLGVTGEDLVRETVLEADRKLVFLTSLGFGNANVVVAVPRAWIDVRSMSDLDDVAASLRARAGQRMRVATKYVNLTRLYFRKHGLADYRIVESAGATEGAPASGAAEIIVDITTTGATLAANALKVLDDGLILRSEAQLVASLTASWSEASREAARSLLQRITAEETARALREVHVDIPVGSAAAFAELPTSFGAERLGGGHSAPPRFLVPREQAPGFCDWLVARGATTVTVGGLDFVYTARNELWEKLQARLDATDMAIASNRAEPAPR